MGVATDIKAYFADFKESSRVTKRGASKSYYFGSLEDFIKGVEHVSGKRTPVEYNKTHKDGVFVG